MDDPLVNSDSLQQLTRSESKTKQDEQIEGFDFLRAISSTLVVALNANLFVVSEIFVSSTLAMILNANVGYVAVPIFFQLSLFLFYIKREKAGFQYFIKKRIPKLISLYLFWVILKIVFDSLFKGKSEAVKIGSSSIAKFIEAIVSGGNSPFYFFFSLIFITVLSEILITLFERLDETSSKVKISYCLLFSSCALLFSLSITHLVIARFEDGQVLASAYAIANLAQWDYNPLNFLPYIFTTAIAVQEFNEGQLQRLTLPLKLKLYSLLALFLMFTILEWSLFEDLLHYARLSLVFGSWLLLYLALLSTRKPSKIIKLLSTCSLGIYVLHPFFTHILFPINANLLLTLSQAQAGLDAIVKFSVALIGSIVLTLIFKKVRGLRRFV